MNSEQIKNLRHKLGDTQTEFATRFGVSRDAVAKWESGERIPSGAVQIIFDSLINNTELTGNKIGETHRPSV